MAAPCRGRHAGRIRRDEVQGSGCGNSGPTPASVADRIIHAWGWRSRRVQPPASVQRVNAPAVTAGPGCESRGVASAGSAAGAPGRAERAGWRPE